MFRNGVQRVKFLPLRSPRRYVENFNGINTLQVLRKEERRLPGNIQRKGEVVRFFVIFVTTNFENHGARLDDNDNAVIAEQGDEKRR